MVARIGFRYIYRPRADCATRRKQFPAWRDVMRALMAAVTLFVITGCASRDEPKPAARKTERERDSVLGASKVPGAGGVGAALRVSDSAAARRAREDSASQP
jgi:hypothetical protein